jgi:hypothetical protein
MFYIFLPGYVVMQPTYKGVVRLGAWPLFEFGYTSLVDKLTAMCGYPVTAAASFSLSALPNYMVLLVARAMVLSSGDNSLGHTVVLSFGSMVLRLVGKLGLFRVRQFLIKRDATLTEEAKVRRRLLLRHRTAQKFVVYNALELAYLVVVVATPVVAGFHEPQELAAFANLYQYAFVMLGVEVVGLVLAWLMIHRPHAIPLIEWWGVVLSWTPEGLCIRSIWIALFCCSALVYPLFWATTVRSLYAPNP